MSTPILTTKFFIPPTRKELVQRQRLLNRLSQGIARKLTLVSGPAGFGKTTLLSAWVAELQRPVGWISLDVADNDWSSFVSFLIKGLQNISAGIANDIIEMLYSAKTQESDAFITYLINQIAEIQTPFLLVLDDYHVITETRIHDLLQLILENQPAQMHLVISTRSDPPWPLARLRARGDLTEIRVRDLRFTLDESIEFLNQIMELDLPAGEVEALWDKTEGWVTGMRLAAISLQQQKDAQSFIQNFTGSHRFVFDYLIDEVFKGLGDDVQGFLLQTSLLERFTPELCNYVRGTSDSQKILNQLEQMNLFLIPLDNQRVWYRYHHLFADLLRKITKQELTGQLTELHRRAREWYQGKELVSEAVYHGIAEGNVDQIANLVENNFTKVLDRRDFNLMAAWLADLPETTIANRPWLSIANAYVLLTVGRADEVHQQIQQAEECLSTAPNLDSEHIRSYIAFIRARLCMISGDVEGAVAHARHAFESLPKSDRSLMCKLSSQLGTALQRSGAFDEAASVFREGISTARALKDSNAVISLYGDLIGLYAERGQLFQAYNSCQEALKYVEEGFRRNGRYTPGAAHINFRLSTISRHWNQLEQSLFHAHKSDHILNSWGLSTRYNSMNLALAMHATGDVSGAHKVLQTAKQTVLRESAHWVQDIEMTEVVLWLAEGNLESPSNWVREQKLDLDDVIDYQDQYKYRTGARVYLAKGQNGDLHALSDLQRFLPRLIKVLEESSAVAYLIQAVVFQALALQAENKLDLALDEINKALDLGEQGEYIWVFIREGTPMLDLLRLANEQRRDTAYMRKLLSAAEEFIERTQKVATSKPVLAEPLTSREVDILRLLDSEDTVAQLAEKLFISVGTARTHIKRIYRKLDVHSRFEAITKARKLNLF